MKKKLQMLKSIVSVMLCLTLVMTNVPLMPNMTFAGAQAVTQTVTTEAEFMSALDDATVDVIELQNEITLSRSADGLDNAFVIPRAVTITGGGLNLERAGIVLGGAVTFENTKIGFLSSVRNAIIVNGYPLTLNNVTSSGTYNIDVFCGGITDYNGGNVAEIPATGNSASVTIKGTNAFNGAKSDVAGGNIFAGSLSDVGSGVADTPNTYSGNVTITIENGASGVGEIYAHGARENRDGGYANAWKPSAELYKVTGGVSVYLNTCTNITLHGATGGTENASFIYKDNGTGSLCEPTLENVASIALVPLEVDIAASIAPKITGTACSLENLEVIENTRLYLQNMPAAVSVENFTGGGIVVFPQGTESSTEKLTITNSAAGDTWVAVGDVSSDLVNSTGVVKNAYTYISFTGDSENSEYSFSLLPGGSNMTIQDDGNGNWITELVECIYKVDTIEISDFVTSQADAEAGVYIPATVTYTTDEDSFLADIPVAITVNGETATRLAGNGGYYFTVGEGDDEITLFFDWDYSGATDGEALYVVNYSAGIPAGTYEIEITIPANNMDDGQEEHLTVVLTVAGEEYICKSNADELNTAIAEKLAAGVTDIKVYLAADAGAEMFTAIRRALIDTESVVDGSVNLTIAGATTIPETAFGYTNSEKVVELKSVVLTDATVIGEEAFYQASKLESVDAPKAVTIGDEAFRNTSLKTINLPEAVTIGSSAFYYCSMTTISLPKAKEFAYASLSYCQSLQTAYLPSASSLGLYVFKGSQELTTLQLGAIESINNGNSIAEHLFESAYPENIDLILSCGQKVMTGSSTSGWNVVSGAEKFVPTDNTFTEYTFKSISFADHVYEEGVCTQCGVVCDHSESTHITYVSNEDGTHNYVCTVCGDKLTENCSGGTASCQEKAVCEYCDTAYGTVRHNVENRICTVCGELDADVVATTTIAGTLSGYTTLEAAIEAVENCMAEDEAVVTLMKDVTLSSIMGIYGGVFTLDLNGKHLDGNNNPYILKIYDGTVIITGNGIMDNVSWPVEVNGGTTIIENGTFTGTDYGVYVSCDDFSDIQSVDIQGGRFSGKYGAYVGSDGSMTVSGDVVFEGTVADIMFDATVTYTSRVSGGPYSVLVNKDAIFAYGAEGITLDEDWFTPVEAGYVIVHDEENNSLSYAKCAHENVEGITCTVCGCEMEAYIEQDGVKTYYLTLYDARSATTSLTNATVVLCKENAGSDYSVGGNYTLDLNGYNVKNDRTDPLWLTVSSNVMKIVNSGQYAEISGKTYDILSQVQLSIGRNVGISSIKIIYGTLDVSEANFESCTITCTSEEKTYDDIILGENYGLFDAGGNEITSGALTLKEVYTIQCMHNMTNAASNEDGTHNVVCNHCGTVTAVNVSCTGGVYTAEKNVLIEKCEACGYVVGTATITCESGSYHGGVYTATVTGTGILEAHDWNIIYSTTEGNAPVNVGTYTASITLGEGEAAATASVEFNIEKATPSLGIVSATIENDCTDISKVVLSRNDITIPGTLTVDANQILVWGENEINYTFTPADTASYEVVTGTVKVTVTDTIAPTAKYQIETNGWKEFVNTITFGIFCKESATVEVQAADNLSGVDSIKYYVAGEELSDFTNVEWKNYDAEKKISLDASGKYIVYVLVSDKAGNVTVEGISTEGIVVYEESTVETAVSYTYQSGESLYIEYVGNGNGIESITCDGYVLQEGTNKDYSMAGNAEVIALFPAWLDSLAVGEYTLTVKFSPQGVITDKVNMTQTITLTVNKPTAVVTTAPTANDFTYNGSAQNLVTTGVAEGGTLVYSLSENGTYTESIPMATNAEEYTVWYYVKGDANHTDSAKSSVKVTIKKVEIRVLMAYAQAREYDGTNKVAVTGFTLGGILGTDNVSIELTNLTGTLSGINVGTYDFITLPTLTLTGEDAVNYTLKQPTEAVGTNVSIYSREVTVTADAKTKVYGEADPALTYTVSGLVEGDTLTGALTRDEGEDAGEYVILCGTLTIENNPNYEIHFVTGKLTITKAATTITKAPVANTLTYNGKAQTLVTAGTANGGTLVYSLTENGEYAEAIPTGKDAGEYTVWYYVKGDANHTDSAKASVKVTVAKCKVTVTADAKTKVYGEEDPALTYTASGLVPGETLTGTLTRVEGEDVGEYEITQGSFANANSLTNANNPNYEITFVGAKLTINKAVSTVTKAPTANELTYNGDAQTLVTAGTANGGTLVYSLTENGEYAEVIPTGKDAGEYTVWYYVKGDANHTDSAKASVKVVIQEAEEDDEVVKQGWVQEESGDWYYYTDGEVDTTINGITPKDGEFWYAVNGKADFSVTTVAPYGGGWWYVESGKVNFGYTGLAQNEGGWWFIQSGGVNFAHTGLVEYYGTWYYVENGALNWNYTGLTLYYDVWYYVEGGVLNWNYTGLTLYYDVWYYVEGGVLNWNYTGLTLYYDVWYYVEGGVLNWNYTGLTLYYDVWYYVEGGVLNWNYTGLTLYYDVWYYVEGGVLNWNYTGLTLYYDTWYYVENGALNWEFTGLVLYYGTWYYVGNGVLDWTFTGTVYQYGTWWYVENGILVGAA